MPRFKGQDECKIDDKGRVAVPSKMRSVFNPEAHNTVVLVPGPDSHIRLYPADTWEEVEAGLVAKMNTSNPKHRRTLRSILRFADEQTLDSQGRIRVSNDLMNYAGLSTSSPALFIGVLNYVEIWSPDHMTEEEAIESPADLYNEVASDFDMGSLF
ncbi:MAG: division/cell wall cluster transcriptional repressor MraZ [Bacteroidota bacterium]